MTNDKNGTSNVQNGSFPTQENGDPAHLSRRRRITTLLLYVVLPIALVLCGLLTFGIVRYVQAKNNREAENYRLAMEQFADLGIFLDSKEQYLACRTALFQQIYSQQNQGKQSEAVESMRYLQSLGLAEDPELIDLQLQVIAQAKPGSVVFWGNEAPYGLTDGEPIPQEWIVLEREGDRVLLLSRYIVAKNTLHDPNLPSEQRPQDLTQSMIHYWLNETYYDRIFTGLERQEGELFILDNKGLRTRLQENAPRIATERGDDQPVIWWLATPGTLGKDYYSYVGEDGRIHTRGMNGATTSIGVRPALWVEVSTEEPQG